MKETNGVLGDKQLCPVHSVMAGEYDRKGDIIGASMPMNAAYPSSRQLGKQRQRTLAPGVAVARTIKCTCKLT